MPSCTRWRPPCTTRSWPCCGPACCRPTCSLPLIRCWTRDSSTVDDLVHGFGGGYLAPVLSHRGAADRRPCGAARRGHDAGGAAERRDTPTWPPACRPASCTRSPRTAPGRCTRSRPGCSPAVVRCDCCRRHAEAGRPDPPALHAARRRAARRGRRRRHRRRPQRADLRGVPRAGRARGLRARGAGRGRRQHGHRGADAARVPARLVLQRARAHPVQPGDPRRRARAAVDVRPALRPHRPGRRAAARRRRRRHGAPRPGRDRRASSRGSRGRTPTSCAR